MRSHRQTPARTNTWAATVTKYYYHGGQTRDASTGLMYYGARFYDPALGRFLSPDSIVPQPGNPQSLNRYSYTLNNPLRYTDPTGHWGFDVHLGLTYKAVFSRALALSIQQGKNPVEALSVAGDLAGSIARADAYVDIAPIEHIGSLDKAYENAKRWAQTPNSELGGQTPEEYYHYPTRDEATARLTAAILGKDPTAFGQALHGFQDYFSHTLNGFTAGPGNIEALTSRCPECLKQGVPIAELIKRARQDGHSDSVWADFPGAPHFAEMQAGTQYWILLFLLYYNGVIDQEQLNQMLNNSADTAQAD